MTPMSASPPAGMRYEFEATEFADASHRWYVAGSEQLFTGGGTLIMDAWCAPDGSEQMVRAGVVSHANRWARPAITDSERVAPASEYGITVRLAAVPEPRQEQEISPVTYKTVRELAAELAALPDELQDVPVAVYSEADEGGDVVTRIDVERRDDEESMLYHKSENPLSWRNARQMQPPLGDVLVTIIG